MATTTLTTHWYPYISIALSIDYNNIGIDGMNAMRGNSFKNMSDFAVEPIDYICYL